MFRDRISGATEENVGASRSSKVLVGLIIVLGLFVLNPLTASGAQPPVGLGTTKSFAVLAGQGVTNTGATVINGNLGTSPNPAVSGFPPGNVNGAIHTADAVALQAQSDLTTAYNDAAGRTPVKTIATELGSRTRLPGVYKSGSGTFQITGTLTLDAQGDPSAVFIFQMAATLVTASSSDVRFVRGAQPCNVFWQVGSSATLGTNSSFSGNILALTSIQVQTGVTVVGRVFARNASVTLDADTITRATCAAVAPPSQVTPIPSSAPQTGGGSTEGLQDAWLFLIGGALLVAGAGAFAIRRRAMRHER